MIIIYCLLGFIAFREVVIIIIFGCFVSKQITDVYMNLDESKLILNKFNPSILSASGFVSKQITDVYINLDESKLSLNQFNSSILNTNCYIKKVPFSIFSKYYISTLGTIPRWSKLHKRVNEYFIIAYRNGQ
jgi:hypothetical protein